MSIPIYMISPCGASIIINLARSTPAHQTLINRYANVKSKDQVPEPDQSMIQSIIDKARDSIHSADSDSARRMSAELNGIILFYGSDLKSASHDHHHLIASSTWIGEENAKLVAEWLMSNGIISYVECIPDLQTTDLDAFNLALSELMKRFYQQEEFHSKSRVVFNLTGGFKAIQGVLQIVAMLYGDETIYVFEGSQQLLRIPRLPLTISAANEIRSNLVAFRRLSLGLDVQDVGSLPEALMMRIDKQVALSVWADVVWNKVKKSIYSEKVWDSPSDRIIFSEAFRKSAKDLSAERNYIINRRLDDLARCIENSFEFNIKSLDLKPLRGSPVSGSTHEFDAWHDQNAPRVFCHFSDNSVVLDRLDKALH